MRGRMSMVSYSMAAVAVVSLGVGLGVGLGLGLGSGSGAGPGPGAGPGLGARSGPGARPARYVGATDIDSSRRLAAAVAHCGHSCISLYSRRLGRGSTMNAAIPVNNGQGGKVGRKLSLRVAADELPDGDFTMSFSAHVWQFCGTDVHDFFAPDSFICTHDSKFSIFEAQWSPYGDSTGLCIGVASANQGDENVTLRQCGESDHTLWIADAGHGTGGDCRGAGDFCPWMNASDNSFRAPRVLTMNGATHAPGDQLRLASMELLTKGGHTRAWTNQLFAFAPNKNT